MSHGRPRRGDDGNAMVEFTWLALLLMIPLVYLMLTVFEVQKAAYAVEAATREAGRAFVTSEDGTDPDQRALAAAQIAAADQGVTLTDDQVRVTCEQQPCLTPGATVEVRIAVRVPLPYLPKILFGGAPASVAVRATHVQVVDAYRDAPADDGDP